MPAALCPTDAIVGQVAVRPCGLQRWRGRVLQFTLQPARVTKPERQNNKSKRRTVLHPFGLQHRYHRHPQCPHRRQTWPDL